MTCPKTAAAVSTRKRKYFLIETGLKFCPSKGLSGMRLISRNFSNDYGGGHHSVSSKCWWISQDGLHRAPMPDSGSWVFGRRRIVILGWGVMVFVHQHGKYALMPCSKAKRRMFPPPPFGPTERLSEHLSCSADFVTSLRPSGNAIDELLQSCPLFFPRRYPTARLTKSSGYNVAEFQADDTSRIARNLSTSIWI